MSVSRLSAVIRSQTRSLESGNFIDKNLANNIRSKVDNLSGSTRFKIPLAGRFFQSKSKNLKKLQKINCLINEITLNAFSQKGDINKRNEGIESLQQYLKIKPSDSLTLEDFMITSASSSSSSETVSLHTATPSSNSPRTSISSSPETSTTFSSEELERELLELELELLELEVESLKLDEAILENLEKQLKIQDSKPTKDIESR